MADITREDENGLRLFLFVEEIAKILRLRLLNNLGITLTDLDTTLNTPGVKSRLGKLKGRILNNDQWSLLYPPHPQTADVNSFDATLLFVLLLNICTTTRTERTHLDKLKKLRNHIIHTPLTTTTTDFNTLSADIINELCYFGGDCTLLTNCTMKSIDNDEAVRLQQVKSDLAATEQHRDLLQKNLDRSQKQYRRLEMETNRLDTENQTLAEKNAVLEDAGMTGVWHNVPKSTDKFVARPEYTDVMYDNLKEFETDGTSAGTILNGMGGVGKTELAADFCHTYEASEFGDTALWIDMESESNGFNSFRDLAIRLRLDITGLSREAVVQRVYTFLSSRRSLVVFDNVQVNTNIELFLPSLPQQSNSPYIIITSQSQLTHLQQYQRISIDVFSSETATSFVTDHLERASIFPTCSEVEELIEAVGCLALALQQSIAFMTTRKIGISKYLSYFKQHFGKLEASFNQHKKSAYTTVQLSLKSLSEIPSQFTTLAYEIIHMCAYVYSADVSMELLCNIPGYEEFDVESAVAILVQQSLLKETTQGDVVSFSMHNITREGIRYTTKDSSVSLVFRRKAIDTIRKCVLNNKRAHHYNFAQHWLTHWEEVVKEYDVDLIDQMKDFLPRIMQGYVNRNDFYSPLCQFKFLFSESKAEDGNERSGINKHLEPYLYFCYMKRNECQHALDLYKELHHDVYTDVDTAELLELVDANIVWNDLNEYKWRCFNLLLLHESPYVKTPDFSFFLEQYEHISLPPGDVKAKAFVRLLLAYHMISFHNYSKSFALFEEAHIMFQEAFGESDGKTIDCLRWMGIVQYYQNKYEEALPLLNDAHEHYKKKHGDEHRFTVRTKLNIGRCLRDKGDLTEALQVLQELLHICTGAFGEDHKESLDTKLDIGRCLCDAGRRREGMEVYCEVLITQERMYGVEHWGTNITIDSIGTQLCKAGMYDRALTMFEQTYRTEVKTLGATHDETMISLDWMSKVFMRKQMYVQSLTGYLDEYKVLGFEHKDTMQVRSEITTCIRRILLQGIAQEVVNNKKKVGSQCTQILEQCADCKLLIADVFHNIGLIDIARALKEKHFEEYLDAIEIFDINMMNMIFEEFVKLCEDENDDSDSDSYTETESNIQTDSGNSVDDTYTDTENDIEINDTDDYVDNDSISDIDEILAVEDRKSNSVSELSVLLDNETTDNDVQNDGGVRGCRRPCCCVL